MEQVKQPCSDLPLQLMLRMIWLCISLPAPADQQQHRDGIHIFICEACNGIDCISLTAVLHIDQRDLFRSQIMACGKSHCISFICRDHISVSAVRQGIIAETIQIAVRNTCKIRYPMLCQTIKYFLLIQHLTSSHLPQSLFLYTV